MRDLSRFKSSKLLFTETAEGLSSLEQDLQLAIHYLEEACGFCEDYKDVENVRKRLALHLRTFSSCEDCLQATSDGMAAISQETR